MIEAVEAVTVGHPANGDTSALPGALAPEPVILSVYARLLDAFARARIVWCYWKSSRRAPEALAGHTDLDILVAPSSQHEARRVLLECGFRRFAPIASRADACVECYLAHDEPSGQIAHVDLHTRLTLGGALLKTHRVPWQDALVRRAAPRDSSRLPVLDPASEAVLLVVRSALELRRCDPIVARRWSSATKKFALDRADVTARVDWESVRARAAELLDERSAAAIATALFASRPLQRQRALRRRVRAALARFRDCSAVEGHLRASGRGLRAATAALMHRWLHWPRPWHRRVAGGGIVVAVIAVDGAGKSTLVRGVCDWLRAEVDVLPVYFGTGDGRPSWILAPLKPLVPLVSRLVVRKPQGASHGVVTERAAGFLYSVLLAVWAIALALEKRLKLRAAHRAASRGMVVITDRFPQDELSEFNDGPLLPRLRHVPRWLRSFEASAYALARQLRPDLVIKLVASPELIASREPTMNPGVVRVRTAALGRLCLGGAHSAAIPASLPAAAVLRAAKRAIWEAL